MSKHIAFLSAAAAVLAACVLPAAAADYYGGDDGALAYGGQDDDAIDGSRALTAHRWEMPPHHRRFAGPAPVVFDEREPGPRFAEPPYGGPAWRRPVPPYGPGRPAGFVPRGEGAYGYRAAAVPVGPAYGAGYGGPDEGCRVERARSITPAGWEKTITYRTCYRR